MMSNTIFDFEKPIYELESKLEEMRQTAQENGVDMESAASELEQKIQDLKVNIYENLSRWQRVQISRHPERPYALDYIEHISEGFIELFGDRNFRDDKAMIGGLARIDGQPVMFIGQQKGRTTKQRQFRNFGMPNPEGYRKALRLMKIAEKFQIPVIALIDTPGAYPGLEAEERGQGEAIARNLMEMAVLRTPIICVVIGEGASGGALGIGVGDKVYMLQNTWYSVISPESCSSILWRSWEHKERAAEALKLTAEDNLRLNIIDGIIREPLGGAHKKPEDAFTAVKHQIVADIAKLSSLDTDTLIQNRIEKFTSIGVFGNEQETNSPVAINS
ncbi:MAG: acetyl-CoA carboxylase carboxyltransferase subunit alpha [Bacteroidota bacterium]